MSLTQFLCEVIGLFFIITAVLMLARKKVFLNIVEGLYSDPDAVFLPGLAATLLGLVMVLSHNIWNGGVFVFVITLVGWSVLLKGLFLLFLPEIAVGVIEIVRIKEWSRIYGALVLIVGAYLTYAGFFLVAAAG